MTPRSSSRLAGHLEAMRAAIGEPLGLDMHLVSVKASTGNLGGDEGAGRAISAQAVVRLEPLP
jgi:2C-methyl-D-erythritol 2,4-cyclodiphosphate synthase